MPQPPATGQEVSIVIAGEAGQGLMTLETLLTGTLHRAGLEVFATKEYMSRVRGGSNSVSIRAASTPVRAFVERVDLALLLDAAAHAWLHPRLAPETLLAGDPKLHPGLAGLIPLPLAQLAEELGDPIYANTVVCGFVVALLGLAAAPFEATLQRQFGASAETLEANLAAARRGRELGLAVVARRGPLCQLSPDPNRPADPLFLHGTAAVALGAIAGGCNFIASYPMSPGTGVLQFLAAQAERFGIVVDQAEDEISAVNMALGSWYAGGRALVSTSGGGFALMGEGVSLAGGIESPLVIHLAQRPGPATGLPTRTEQGDLDLALYSGHGEFPRAILAPGTLEEAFTCARVAFDLADACQSPVFILTDQYLLDSGCTVPSLPLPAAPPEARIVATAAGYRRYAPADDGVSPRGIPGLGAGRVCVDSDEHDDQGRITELAAVRRAMVDKRLRKEARLGDHPELTHRLTGPENFDRLLVGWGSTRPALDEALARVGDSRTALLHTPQLYPLSAAVRQLLRRAKRLIVVENNATGQFARLIQRETGRAADASWRQYDGRPFSVEDLVRRLQEEVAS